MPFHLNHCKNQAIKSFRREW